MAQTLDVNHTAMTRAGLSPRPLPTLRPSRTKHQGSKSDGPSNVVIRFVYLGKLWRKTAGMEGVETQAFCNHTATEAVRGTSGSTAGQPQSSTALFVCISGNFASAAAEN